MSYILDQQLRGEAWKFYFVVFAWPVYLFLLPEVYHVLGLFSILFMIFPGVYLFTWTGYLMHECWHKYVPGIPNEFFYRLFSWMMLTDPQIYKMLHGGHHMNVNTWEDTEFHPLGRIQNVSLRRLYHTLEIVIGVAFLVLVSLVILPGHPKYRDKFRWSSLLTAVFGWAVIYGGTAYLAGLVFGLTVSGLLIPLGIQLWLGSFILHHSQLVEHGNLIVAGSYNERNIATRNLSNEGLPENIFLFLTHNDSREHVLHHVLVKEYSRPFPGQVPLPGNAIRIKLRDYVKIVGKMITGKENEQIAGTRVTV